ncbi:MAG: argininosuccinate lyase [Chloroflexi bacterium]|nr:argininosuccinate lyase [Chloroflexota bacterium]
MLWGSRFDKALDELVARFNNSFYFDWRLYDADIRGSIAYAQALARAGLLTDAEMRAIERGLNQIRDEFARGVSSTEPGTGFVAQPDDEDIHTAVERRLFELIGDPAHKLHTGRSRNDQVATDTRLYVMDAIDRLQSQVSRLQSQLVAQAERHFGILMPGYTHVRRAQPILFSHYLLSFFWMLHRDRERFADAKKRASVLPLGAGALAGNPFHIDREFLARALGFERVSENSLDAVSDRDFIAEFLFAASLLQIHLSRLAEDLILYSAPEFGFIALDDAYTTGSSLMPQKKNPDALELVRGKTGRTISNLQALLITLKGLPSTYNKDLQEDKEPLFDAVDTLEMTLPVVAGVIQTLRVNVDAMRAALDEGMLATDLAEYLVRRGVPFRRAHHLVGALVKQAETRGVKLSALSLDEFRAVSDAFSEDVYAVFDFDASVKARDVFGGTSPRAVREQIADAKKVLAK